MFTFFVLQFWLCVCELSVSLVKYKQERQPLCLHSYTVKVSLNTGMNEIRAYNDDF